MGTLASVHSRGTLGRGAAGAAQRGVRLKELRGHLSPQTAEPGWAPQSPHLS